jgi:hypothetical protein
MSTPDLPLSIDPSFSNDGSPDTRSVTIPSSNAATTPLSNAGSPSIPGFLRRFLPSYLGGAPAIAPSFAAHRRQSDPIPLSNAPSSSVGVVSPRIDELRFQSDQTPSSNVPGSFGVVLHRSKSAKPYSHALLVGDALEDPRERYESASPFSHSPSVASGSDSAPHSDYSISASSDSFESNASRYSFGSPSVLSSPVGVALKFDAPIFVPLMGPMMSTPPFGIPLATAATGVATLEATAPVGDPSETIAPVGDLLESTASVDVSLESTAPVGVSLESTASVGVSSVSMVLPCLVSPASAGFPLASVIPVVCLDTPSVSGLFSPDTDDDSVSVASVPNDVCSVESFALPGIASGSLSFDTPEQPEHQNTHPPIGKSPRLVDNASMDNCNGFSFDPLSFVACRVLAGTAAPGSDVVFRSFDLESIPVTKKRKKISAIIDTNYPLPVMEYTTMEPYRLSIHDAPRRRAIFLVEKLYENASSRVFSQTAPKRLMTPGTKRVVGIHRGRTGMYLTNQSRRQVHYEEDSRQMKKFVALAKKQNIQTKVHCTRGEPYHGSQEGWNLFFLNGTDWRGHIRGMHLEEIAHTILFPGGTKIPKAGKRGNRGKSLGWTGGQSLSKKNSHTAEPSIIHGSLAFGPLFVRMTALIKEMAVHAGFEVPFTDTSGMFSNRPSYAQKIHADNSIESLSILCLIHDHDFTNTADWLREHFDRENCPYENWDWLGCVYEDVFVKSLGRWVTVVITATSRKSISDSIIRSIRIQGAAEDLLKRYRLEEKALRFVMPASLCSPNVPYQEVDIHFDIGVHLSPLLFHVMECQEMLESELSEVMPLTLILELVYAFFSTNNSYRFHVEIKEWLQMVRQRGIVTLRDGFILPYLSNLIRKYGALDGIESKKGLREGAVRFQACNGSIVTDATIHQNLRDVMKIVTALKGVRATLVIFKRTVRALEKAMHGNGPLCSQKVAYALAYLGILDRSFLRFCLPGSKKHFQRLQSTKYSFDTVDQVQQLVDAISSIGDENGVILAPKAEEIVCKMLKPPGSQYKDCVIRWVDLFWAVGDILGNVKVLRLRYGQPNIVTDLEPISYVLSADSCYHPPWAQVESRLNFSGLRVRFGSDRNKKFTVCEKTGSTAQVRLQQETIVSHEDDFCYSQVQTLLNKNKSLFLSDPIGFIVDAFGINRHCFVDSIRTIRSRDGTGWLSTLNPSLFKDVPLIHPFQQISNVHIPRRCSFDVKHNTPSNVCYHSKEGSVMALLLHLLMNIRLAHRNHWTKGYLNDTKEFVLLIPGNKDQTFGIAVAVVYRLHEKILMRQLHSTTLEVERPIRIGHLLESN